jgi:hypothetical protein
MNLSMHVYTTSPEPKFQPVTLTIRFDSQAELDGLAGIVNHAGVTKAAEAAWPGLHTGDILSALISLGGNPSHQHGTFCDELRSRID